MKKGRKGAKVIPSSQGKNNILTEINMFPLEKSKQKNAIRKG